MLPVARMCTHCNVSSPIYDGGQSLPARTCDSSSRWLAHAILRMCGVRLMLVYPFGQRFIWIFPHRFPFVFSTVVWLICRPIKLLLFLPTSSVILLSRVLSSFCHPYVTLLISASGFRSSSGGESRICPPAILPNRTVPLTITMPYEYVARDSVTLFTSRAMCVSETRG